MEELYKDGVWQLNRAPGSGTGSVAPPGIPLCSMCGRDISCEEDCLDRLVEDAISTKIIYLCLPCWKAGLS